MNDGFDRIRDIQAKLAKLSCPSCRWERGLALILRYAGHGESCLFIASCKSCQMKYPVNRDTADFMLIDNHGLSTNSFQRNPGHHTSLRSVQ